MTFDDYCAVEYDAEVCNDLSNMERVRWFWHCTTMNDSEFRDIVCKLLGKQNINVYDDFTPEFIVKILQSYVREGFQARYSELASDREEIRNWTAVCLQTAVRNVEHFLSPEKSEYSTTILNDFGDLLITIYQNEELVLELLLNFIRSVVRNDYEHTSVDGQVNYQRGISGRIWKNAAQRCFSREYIKR